MDPRENDVRQVLLALQVASIVTTRVPRALADGKITISEIATMLQEVLEVLGVEAVIEISEGEELTIHRQG